MSAGPFAGKLQVQVVKRIAASHHWRFNFDVQLTSTLIWALGVD